MSKTLGVLCPLASVYSKYGIGDFGQSSLDFIDFLSTNGFGLWQILPLNTTNDCNCPYSSPCCFSFDEMYIDPEELLQNGYLSHRDLLPLKKLSKTKKIDYKNIKAEKRRLLEICYTKITNTEKLNIKAKFETSFWLYDYSCFRALLDTFNTTDFRQIPSEYWNKNSKAYREFVNSNEDKILKYGYFQSLLLSQWQKVRAYAKQKGVKILGDIPIYPHPNSFDVFFNAKQFKVNNKTLTPLVYGGVPSDDGCDNAQNWGTCVYDWNALKKTGYKFLIDKITTLLTHYDILRLDHFYGYVEHFEWDAAHPTTGKWLKEGGADFFEALQAQCDINRLVVEDIGPYRPEIYRIKNKFNLLGMNVLQYVSPKDTDSNILPQNVDENCIYYLGTHDNNTFIGFLEGLTTKDKQDFCKFLEVPCKSNNQILVDCIAQLIKGKSKIVVLQLQDLLMQNEEFRTNIPGQALNCWEYKAPQNYKSKAENTLQKIKQKLSTN